MTDRQREELKAFTLSARKCTLPLLEESETETAILGTGTLFTVNGEHYLITAAHVIEKLIDAKQLDRIGIPLGLTKAPVSNLGSHFITYAQPKDGSDAGPLDVAMIRFDSKEAVAALEENWTFLSPASLGPIPKRKQGFLVAGYPREVSSSAGFQISAKFMSFATNSLDPVPEEFRDYRPGLDIALKHEESGEGLDGKQVDLPRLQGVSGGSVWVAHWDDGTAAVWNAASHLKLVGNQSAYMRGTYIRAKSWEFVARLFERVDPDAARQIRMALGLKI